MINETFSGVLTFAVLIGGTVAIGSEMIGTDSLHAQAAPAAHVAQATVVTMPTITIVGRRADVMVARADVAAKTVE